MARKEIYSIQDIGEGKHRVLKGDHDFNPTGSYVTSAFGRFCDCFAGNKEICRHRTFVQDYLSNQPTVTFTDEHGKATEKTCREMIQDGWWLEIDKAKWVQGPKFEA
jgi:hypothetical protein